VPAVGLGVGVVHDKLHPRAPGSFRLSFTACTIAPPRVNRPRRMTVIPRPWSDAIEDGEVGVIEREPDRRHVLVEVRD
jgi:hypothetical protein